MSFPQAPLARLFALYTSLYDQDLHWVHSENEINTVTDQWCDAYGVDHEAYFKALKAWYHVDTSADSAQHPLGDYLLFEALCSIAREMEWYNLHESLYAFKKLARYSKAESPLQAP